MAIGLLLGLAEAVLALDLNVVEAVLEPAPWQADRAKARRTTKKKMRLIINKRSRSRVNRLIVPAQRGLQADC